MQDSDLQPLCPNTISDFLWMPDTTNTYRDIHESWIEEAGSGAPGPLPLEMEGEGGRGGGERERERERRRLVQTSVWDVSSLEAQTVLSSVHCWSDSLSSTGQTHLFPHQSLWLALSLSLSLSLLRTWIPLDLVGPWTLVFVPQESNWWLNNGRNHWKNLYNHFTGKLLLPLAAEGQWKSCLAQRDFNSSCWQRRDHQLSYPVVLRLPASSS